MKVDFLWGEKVVLVFNRKISVNICLMEFCSWSPTNRFFENNHENVASTLILGNVGLSRVHYTL